MKKYYNKSKFIIIILTTLIIFMSIIIGNISVIEQNIKKSNMINSRNAIELSFSEHSESEIQEFLSELKKIDDIIIKYYFMDIVETQTNHIGNILGIFFEREYTHEFKMKSGRFLDFNDFNENSKVAVIGEDIENYTEKQDGSEYITIGNDKYEVIGIIEGNNKLKNSDYIFYNLNPVIEKEHNIQKHWWIVDSISEDSSYIVNELNKINSKFNGKTLNIMQHGNTYDKGDSLYLIMGMIIAFGLCSIAILLTLIRSIIMWIDSLKIEIGVRFTCGSTRKQILILLINQYISFATISSLIAIILLFILIQMNLGSIILFELNFNIIGFSFITSILTGLLIIPIMSLKFKSLKASKLLKGGI